MVSESGLLYLVKSCWSDVCLTNSFKTAHLTPITFIDKPTPVPRPSCPLFYTAGPGHKGYELYCMMNYTRPIYCTSCLILQTVIPGLYIAHLALYCRRLYQAYILHILPYTADKSLLHILPYTVEDYEDWWLSG